MQQENTPQYIKQLPWYAQVEGKALEVTPPAVAGALNQEWYDRGKRGYQANTFRKGACENCGAIGHAKKQCTERPRKIAAKFTNSKIAADDVVKDLKFSWEQKRDRWNGYNSEMYKEVIEEFDQYEQARKKVKLDEGVEDPDAQFKAVSDPLAVASLPSKHAKNQKFQGLGGVRNREDRAKYLLNLDLHSAHFDPKSRSMAGEDEYANQLTNMEVLGEKYDLIEQDKFAFQQVQKHHAELNSTALPTLTQKIYKSITQKRSGANAGKMGEVIKMYGVEDSKAPMDIVYEEEQFVNYQPAKTHLMTTVKSKYEEDVLVNDHISVWGSWYNPVLGWGYDCCYSTQPLSFCSGVKGRERALAKELRIKTEELRQTDRLAVRPVIQPVEVKSLKQPTKKQQGE